MTVRPTASLARRSFIAGLTGVAGLAGWSRFAHAADPVPRLDMLHFDAPGIGALRVSVWTPPGYAGGTGRHGVLYMHDGQNLFIPAQSGYGKVWHVDRAVMALAGSGAIDPPIIVAVWNLGSARFRTYLPQRVHAGLPGRVRQGLAPLVGDGPVQSDLYVRFLADQLRPVIDRTYRTHADRSHRWLMGSSMGGLISLYTLAERPDVFAGAGCLSTHWPMFLPPEGTDAPYRTTITTAWTRYLRARLGPAAGRRIWFDHGTETLDRLYAPYQNAIDRLLPALGWRAGRDVVSRVYPGQAHEEGAWAARVAEPIRFVLTGQGG